MKLKILIFLMMISLASAGYQICFDNQNPSAPQNIQIIGDASSRIITWNAATDEPSCSGIEKYVILRNEIQIGETTHPAYTDDEDLSEGTYRYNIYAIDLVGNSDNQTSTFSISSKKTSSASGGAKGGRVCRENWTCSNWSGCIDGNTTRTCSDLNACGSDRYQPSEISECETTTVDGKEGQTIEFEQSPQTEGFISAITGGVIGVLSGKSLIAIIIFIGLLLAALVFVTIKRRNKLK